MPVGAKFESAQTYRLRRPTIGDYDHCCSVREDFGHHRSQFRGVEAHRQHRVGPEALGVVAEALYCLMSSLLEEPSVYLDFPAPPTSEVGPDILPETARTYD